MPLVAPHLAWPELERRAGGQLASFRLPHQPDALARARLWEWFSLGMHVTWAVFDGSDGTYIVRARWDRQEAAALATPRGALPVSSAALEPRVLLHTLRAPAGFAESVVALLRPHMAAEASASLGIDGTEFGFELLTDQPPTRVAWWNESAPEATRRAFAEAAQALDSGFP